MELSWNNSANDFDLGLYDESQSLIDSSLSDNPEFVDSGSTDVSNTTVYILVQSVSGSWGNGGEGEYTLNITFVNQSDVPGLNQNDAYTGEDAGDEYSNATLWSTPRPAFIWPGYVDSGSDEYDYYQVYVPVDHGISLELSPGAGQSDWLTLALYDSSNSQIDSSLTSNPQAVSTNASGTFTEARTSWSRCGPTAGGQLQPFNVDIHPDADGDGYYDQVEYSCGSDPNDNSSTPRTWTATGYATRSTRTSMVTGSTTRTTHSRRTRTRLPTTMAMESATTRIRTMTTMVVRLRRVHVRLGFERRRLIPR